MKAARFLTALVCAGLLVVGCGGEDGSSGPRPTAGTISGQVTEVGTEVTLAGASVSMQPVTSPLTTDVQGNYTISDVAPGSYTVTATRSGYETGSATVTVSAGQTSTANIELAPVAGGLTFAAVSAGASHTCGVTTNGLAYCWGSNIFGELGDGTQISRGNPVLVSGGLTFAAVSAGASHTCGLTTNGVAYCWGRNDFGELGDGTTLTSRTSPVLVVGGLTFAAVSAGGSRHTCGVTTSGEAYCWGDNSKGQLGDATLTARPNPVPVSGGRTYAAVSAGASHTCGVTTSGEAYCWGRNDFGQLGDGAATDPRTSPVPVSGGFTFATVSPGDLHSCGVTTSGAAHCWGLGDFGQLGDGMTTASRPSPVSVAGELTFGPVSAGGQDFVRSHTCGVITSRAAYCWGSNADGQLGEATLTTLRRSPVRVVGGLTFTAVSAGGRHTCGLTTDGVAYCWGSNIFGQLGDGTSTKRLSPERVAPSS